VEKQINTNATKNSSNMTTVGMVIITFNIVVWYCLVKINCDVLLYLV